MKSSLGDGHAGPISPHPPRPRTDQPEPLEEPLPSPKPVGHQGIRVDVEEHAAWQGNGFTAALLVLVFLVGAAGSILTLSPAGIAAGVIAALPPW